MATVPSLSSIKLATAPSSASIKLSNAPSSAAIKVPSEAKLAIAQSSTVKVPFRVVYFSSEDAGYPASELNLHGPATLGWQSLKFCDYPQEIGLLIIDSDKKSKFVSQLQLLSHQSKIASRIEIFLGLGVDYSSATYERLGFMTLDINEKSNLTARELKTVYIDDKSGQFLKLIIHRPHHNTQNLFTQVGIIAINILGSEAAPQVAESKEAAMVAPTAAASGAKSASNEPLKNATNAINTYVKGGTNDLSYTYSMDPQTAKRLKYLADVKEAAITSEDFVRAKRVKMLENELKRLGSRLVQLDVAKADAVKVIRVPYPATYSPIHAHIHHLHMLAARD